jgi:hypothetical protein
MPMIRTAGRWLVALPLFLVLSAPAHSPNQVTVNRLEPVATFHFPTAGRLLIFDRNRAERRRRLWKSAPSPDTPEPPPSCITLSFPEHS